jgi:phosphoribosyl 1,2-cyclic phosphodiesterase
MDQINTISGGANFSTTFLGVRGSTPCSGIDYQIFGGHTSCVLVDVNDKILIFDAGSGIFSANKILKDRDIKEFDLFFSHVHLDHILGLPFFMPLWRPDVKIRIHAGSLGPYGGIEHFLKKTFSAPLFPVEFSNLPAQISFHDFEPGADIQIDDLVRVKTCALNHPNGAVAYRTNFMGKSVSYVTDTEHPEVGHDQSIIDFIRGTNLFIYDSSYENENYHKFKGWGHSTWQECCQLAELAAVEKFAVFHHDPMNTDEKMFQIEAEVKRIAKNAIVCRQGMRIDL